MEGTYAVMLGQEKRGTVTVTGEGLYWKIVCGCSLYSEVMQELVAQAGDRQIKLGVLVPEGTGYSLRARIKKKELSNIDGFYIRPRHETMEGDFYPIKPEEPFAYLHRLEDAFLCSRNGKTGIVLQK